MLVWAALEVVGRDQSTIIVHEQERQQRPQIRQQDLRHIRRQGAQRRICQALGRPPHEVLLCLLRETPPRTIEEFEPPFDDAVPRIDGFQQGTELRQLWVFHQAPGPLSVVALRSMGGKEAGWAKADAASAIAQVLGGSQSPASRQVRSGAQPP
eukprot:CAMPEP_0115599752 /NCGR_PEP_ID=MMETSP0272-20121206/14546_1 /TAXON_ID=71861 /ORGANISM="Scrippsiella trochoidea, Strain CCMP3099" /LENGTH=153 /DNA_ID=CAMNT_0003035197 /DNA_START=538 /DNA_END=996 /DNA_ORIENTATION=+